MRDTLGQMRTLHVECIHTHNGHSIAVPHYSFTKLDSSASVPKMPPDHDGFTSNKVENVSRDRNHRAEASQFKPLSQHRARGHRDHLSTSF